MGKAEVQKPYKPKQLWYVHGEAYDLTEFLDHHPGGRQAMKMGQGLNCTELFETYHFKRYPPESILEKYRISSKNCILNKATLREKQAEVENLTPEERLDLLGEHYTFDENGFYKTVKRRVQKYFEENPQLEQKGSDIWRILAFVQIFTIACLMYPAFILGSIPVAMFLGVFKGVTAVGTGHALSHYALFNGKANLLLFRLCAPIVLSNVEIWSTSHVISHHIHTLTKDDLQDNYPLKRIQPAHPHRAWHKYQHYYVWLVYMIGLPIWTLVDFLSSIPVLFTGRHEMRYFSIPQRIENFVTFGLNLLLTVFLPFYFHEFYHALAVSFLSNLTASLTVVLQITVNHEVPETMAKLPDGRIDWGVHQALTSHNYGVNSLFYLHYSGGLNMQVEHHLFPSMHYTHYHAIAKIVKPACEEFGLPYNTSADLFEALYKHYCILRFKSTA